MDRAVRTTHRLLTRDVIKVALLATTLVAGVATNARAQSTISGTVTSSSPGGALVGTVIDFYDLNDNSDNPPATATTDGSGHYTSPTLPAGTYAVYTQDNHGYINKFHNNLPCPPCDFDSLTGVVVVSSAVTGIDFVLDPGGRISGTVTDSGSLLPITGISLGFFTSADDQFPFTTATTDGAGHYLSNGGMPTGGYWVATLNSLGYQDEVYSNHKCLNCDISSTGDLVGVALGATTSNIDFALDPGGRIAGHVQDNSSNPLANVEVSIYNSDGTNRLDHVFTDGSGNFISGTGLPTGNYYAATSNSLGLIDKVYNNIVCAGGSCDPTTGTAIPVTSPSTTSNINFVLSPGGRIAGHVQDISSAPLTNVDIIISDSSGIYVTRATTDVSGNFISSGLPTGTYYAGTSNHVGLSDKVFNGLLCAGSNCNPLFGGTPIAVTSPSTTSGINFVLPPGGTVTGTVTNAVGNAPLSNVFVGMSDAFGTFVGGANTNGSGVFTTGALPAGIYYATVQQAGFLNQIYDHAVCCGTVAGTPITIATNSTTSGINFALWPSASAGSISGTVKDLTNTAINNVPVQAVLSTNGNQVASVNTNSSGIYTIPGLAPGSYYVRTGVGGNNFVNQVYNGVTCVGCTVTSSGGTPVTVAASTTTPNINFALATGGRISGVITNNNGGGFLQNILAQVFNSSGVAMGSANTNASGAYTTQALPPGTYYIRTSNSLGFINKVYTSVVCPGAGCNVLLGTPITVTASTTTPNINFGLDAGGRLSGTLTNAATLVPLQSQSVGIFDALGVSLGNAPVTDASGNYTSFGLPAGKYYVRTNNSLGLIDKLYDNIPCLNAQICPAVSGTSVTVTGTATTTGVNFALSPAFAVSGKVTDSGTTLPISGVQVQVFDGSGVFARSGTTNSSGYYIVGGLPAGTYYARTSVGGSLFYQDELFSEKACNPTCTVTDGDPIVLSTSVAGATGVNFTLTPGGGGISGTITDASTALPVLGVSVQVFTSGGVLAKSSGGSTATGAFTVSGLPAGTYYARTAVTNSVNYADELYSNKAWPCSPACAETTGTAIVVTNAATTSGIDFSLAPNLVHNGQFDAGTTTWSLFATSTGGTADNSYLESNVTGGVFQFRRLPQVSGQPVNQAVVFDSTGVAVGAGVAMTATFQLGNTSNVRKYMKVLLGDVSFNDLAACTFWFEPHAPLRTFKMKTHSTIAWTNATLSFYASSVKTDDAYYQLDNVSLELAPAGSTGQTECIDPTAPATGIGAPGSNLLVNGDFNTGVLSPWSLFGTITAQNPIAGGVFEFIRPSGTPPPGLVLQLTGQAMTLNQLLTLNFQLGNSSTVRKRALVLVNDSDFSDLIACTFWLPAGQALSNYRMAFYTTKAWGNAQVSIYPSTTGPDQWIRLDNVTLQRTPAAVTVGTECLEPAALGARAGDSGASTASVVASAPELSAPAGFSAEGFVPSAGSAPQGSGPAWETMANVVGTNTLDLDTPIDLVSATRARLSFESWLSSTGSHAEVQVRATGGGDWVTVNVVAPSDIWTPVEVNLDDFLGQVIELRLTFEGAAPVDPAAPDLWRVAAFDLDISTAQLAPGGGVPAGLAPPPSLAPARPIFGRHRVP